MIRNILFDFDGTLVDTSEGIVKSMQYACDCLGYDNVRDEIIRKWIGPPLQEMLQRILSTGNDDEIRNGIRLFRERYEKFGIVETSLYPYVQENLQKMKSKGIRLFIATSKPEAFVEKISKRYDIIDYFDEISAVKMHGTSPSKTERIGCLMKKHKMYPENTIMIGDRHEDAEAASANLLRCIGVSYGYDDINNLKKYGCWKIVGTFHEIYETVINE